MSTPEIIRKLAEELDKGITTEVQIVCARRDKKAYRTRQSRRPVLRSQIPL